MASDLYNLTAEAVPGEVRGAVGGNERPVPLEATQQRVHEHIEPLEIVGLCTTNRPQGRSGKDLCA